jgi:LysR family transcriptional regulator, regulator for metE and metH
MVLIGETVEIRHLKLVEEVASQGSLTNAAKNLYLTQSALSHQLKEVEDKFGTPLFRRINKKMILTQAGERVLKSARIILDELERTEREIKTSLSGESGIIRMSTECYTCYHWLPPLLKTFNTKFPNVDIKIVSEATRYPDRFLLSGRLDLAIDSTLKKGTPLKYRQLFTDELVAVIPSDHQLAAKTYFSAKDFLHENYITYTDVIEESTVFQKILIPAGVRPFRTTKILITEAIIEMVKAGLGITTLARWAAVPYLKTGELVAIPLTQKGLKRTWYAVTMKENNPPSYLNSFIQHLVDNPIHSKQDKDLNK